MTEQPPAEKRTEKESWQDQLADILVKVIKPGGIGAGGIGAVWAGLFHCQRWKSEHLMLSFSVLESSEPRKRGLRIFRYLPMTMKQPCPLLPRSVKRG